MSGAPAAVDRRTLVLARSAVVAIFFVSGAGMGVWAAHIPLLKAGLALSDSQLGVVLLAMGIGAVGGMPLTSFLLRRFGAVAVTISAAFLFAAALAAPPLAPSFAWLSGISLLLGALLGGLDVAMNAHAVAVETAWRRPIMSSIHAFFSIGGLVGASAAGGLIALDFDAAASMGLCSVALLAITAVAAFRLSIGSAAESEAGHGFRLPNAAVLGLGAITLLALLTEGAMVDWSAVFLVQATAASPALAAGGYAAFSAAMTLGRLGGDRVVAKLGPMRTVRLSGVVAAAGLALVVAASGPMTAIIGFIVTGFGLANIVPVLFSASARIPGVSPATALAMVASMAYGGGLMGPPLIGFLSDAVGLRAAFVVLVAAAGAAALGAGRAIGRL